MNTKVAVAMLLLIVIASTAMLMESNEVYSHNNSNVQLKAFGNSTILYHNSTYIMGKMDGLYFTDIYNNGWHYTILNSAPAINSSISDAVISDKIVSDTTSTNNTIVINFSGNPAQFNGTYNQINQVAVYLRGYISLTPSASEPVNEYLPFSLSNTGTATINNNTIVNNTLNGGIWKINITFTPTSNIYNTKTLAISPSNNTIIFLPSAQQGVTDNSTQYMTFYYTGINSYAPSPSEYYLLNITDNGNDFAINIDKTHYPFENHLTIILANGTYNYSFETAGSSHYSNGVIIISGKNVNLDLAYSYLPTANIQNYLYIALVMLFMLIFARFIRGYLIGYTVIGSFFLYIGYMSGLQYFTIDTIIYIVLLLAGIITFKLVME